MSHPRTISMVSRQHGAALFVGLIILIVLALIGITAMQSTLLQERMSGNFRVANVAFQNTEEQVRLREGAIQLAANANQTFSPNDRNCGGFNYGTWVPAQTVPADSTSEIDQCIATWASRAMGAPQNVRVDDLFRVSAFAPDQTPDALSTAVVETIYIP